MVLANNGHYGKKALLKYCLNNFFLVVTLSFRRCQLSSRLMSDDVYDMPPKLILTHILKYKGTKI